MSNWASQWARSRAHSHTEIPGNSLNTVRPTFNCPKPNSGWWVGKDGEGAPESGKDLSKDEELALIKKKEQDLRNQML